MKNFICLHGYLGRDPELKEMNGQNRTYKRVNFSLAVDRSFGDETDWFYCIMTGKRAETIDKYFHKGSQIIVFGRLESYKPKNDPDHTSWIVKMEDFDFCDKNTNGSGTQHKSEPSEDPKDDFEDLDEDVPF